LDELEGKGRTTLIFISGS